MALPKRRHSIGRGRRRRTHWKLKKPLTMVCAQCKKRKLQGRICPFCGYYKGREVVKIENLDDRKKKREDKNKKK